MSDGVITYLAVILIFAIIFGRRGERRPRPRSKRFKLKGGRVTKFEGPPGPPPVTPGPRYICQNCGMLVNTGHGHTRDECEAYDNDPTKPDLRLVITLRERKGSNDPRIRLPRYYEPGTFKNWGPGVK